MKTKHFKYFSVLFPELTVYCKIYLEWMFGNLFFLTVLLGTESFILTAG